MNVDPGETKEDLRRRMLCTALEIAIVILLLLLVAVIPARCQYTTLVGTLQGSNGTVASNYTLTFTPSQTFFVAGTGVVVSATTNCLTSIDGSVVGIGNPLAATTATASFSGLLPAGTYYVEYTFYTASAETLASPETVWQLTSTGSLNVNAPASGIPTGASGMRVYIGTASGGETLQGSTVGTAQYNQSTSLNTGSTAPPATNTTLCKQVANDAGWPTGTGYTVSMSDASGNTLPGYPMQWQLIGPNTTINLSSGLPYYHATVYFPSPVLASPLGHAAQSIAGPLNLTGFNLFSVGSVGCGTALPSWTVDCPTVNARTGFLYQGSAPTNHVLLGNGTYYVDSATLPYNMLTGVPPIGAVYYQTVAAAGTALTQRPTVNFAGGLTATDSASPAQTNVGLATTGVTAGSYTQANITVGADGRLLAAANGAALDYWFTFTGCAPQNPYNGDASCGVAGQALPTTFADTAYFLNCTTQVPTGTAVPTGSSPAVGTSITVQNATASTFNYIVGFTYSGSSPVVYTPTVVCHAHHN